MPSRRQEALDYHAQGRPGKIEVSPTKPFKNQRDLSLAYTPGVAEPCLEIQKRPDDAYTYTAQGNLVAVVTNGTAVLGLGNIGALAGKPVMEGKGILFKQFADIDVFDLEVGSEDPDDVIRFCQLLEPTVGGINLEDIAFPGLLLHRGDAAEDAVDPGVPRRPARHGDHLRRRAAQRDSSWSTRRSTRSASCSRAPAPRRSPRPSTTSGWACRARTSSSATSAGVLHEERSDLDPYKRRFARTTPARTLAERCTSADVFVGLSVGGIVTGDMIRAMAQRPIVFALANPDTGDHAGRGARAPARTRSSPPAAPTFPTRSTTSSAFRSFFAARSTCARRRSTRR